MKQLILASASAARKEILERAGVDFTVQASKYEEDMSLDMQPKELAIHLSRGKARDVALEYKNALILGADSFAALDGRLLGKPANPEEARQMLQSLSGRCHIFITGFTIIDTGINKEYSEAVETKVYFRKLNGEEIGNYLAKENVLNNAGAYIIQGLGGALIDKIDGDFSNVMGLPLSRVAAALKEFGLDVL